MNWKGVKMSIKRQIAKLLENHGYTLKRQTNHLIWVNPRGQVIVTPSTPSDHRTVKNIFAIIKRQVA